MKSALRKRLAPAELHHQWGHDLILRRNGPNQKPLNAARVIARHRSGSPSWNTKLENAAGHPLSQPDKPTGGRDEAAPPERAEQDHSSEPRTAERTMDVTLEVEHRGLPAETLEYSQGWFQKAIYKKKEARSVHSVICTVQFESEEREIIKRAGLLDHVIWQGPEEHYYDDNDLNYNLSLTPMSKDAFSIAHLVGFVPLVEPHLREFVRQPSTRRQSTYVRDLIGGRPHVIYDCDTLAEANLVEEAVREGLIKLKALINFNDKPANRVSTFKL
jgi:hypothetical protein